MVDGTLAPLEEFDNLEALKVFLRPQTDQIMLYHHPDPTEPDREDGHRLAEEQHNVSVPAYIHAIKHENGLGGDNDFSVMLGSDATPGTGIFLIAEASALPKHGPHQNLLANARKQLLSIVGPCHCNDRFMRVSPPIHVRVTGSLFFDEVHAIRAVGPSYARPFTAWEIHPILSIERLDGKTTVPSRPTARADGS